MYVEIDNESKKWIKAKGNQLTVKILETKTCCAPGVQEVVAVPGKPKTTDQFTELKVIIYPSMYIKLSVTRKNSHLNYRVSAF